MRDTLPHFGRLVVLSLALGACDRLLPFGPHQADGHQADARRDSDGCEPLTVVSGDWTRSGGAFASPGTSARLAAGVIKETAPARYALIGDLVIAEDRRDGDTCGGAALGVSLRLDGAIVQSAEMCGISVCCAELSVGHCTPSGCWADQPGTPGTVSFQAKAGTRYSLRAEVASGELTCKLIGERELTARGSVASPTGALAVMSGYAAASFSNVRLCPLP